MSQRPYLPLLAVVALFGGACVTAQDVQCADDFNCDRFAGGECRTAPSGSSWCVYPDDACPSGERWSDLDVGDGLSGVCVGDMGNGPDAATADAGMTPDGLTPDGASPTIDAGAPDAMPDIIQWDLVYPRRIRVPLYTQAVLGGESRHMIVNVGTEPIDMTTLTPGTSTDDHVTAIFDYLVAEPEPTLNLPPGSAIGMLPAAQQSLVPEPVAMEQAILRYDGKLFPANGQEATIEVTNRVTVGGSLLIFPTTWEIADVGFVQVVEYDRISSNAVVLQ